MSRSFKHNAIIKDYTKGEKKRASKKAFESWKIHDYKFRFDKNRGWANILDFISK